MTVMSIAWCLWRADSCQLCRAIALMLVRAAEHVFDVQPRVVMNSKCRCCLQRQNTTTLWGTTYVYTLMNNIKRTRMTLVDLIVA